MPPDDVKEIDFKLRRSVHPKNRPRPPLLQMHVELWTTCAAVVRRLDGANLATSSRRELHVSERQCLEQDDAVHMEELDEPTPWHLVRLRAPPENLRPDLNVDSPGGRSGRRHSAMICTAELAVTKQPR
ncbi:hypothetical protein ACCO45_000009 [Purpureocillium lilacinum]|uniref:Uncharacterized protein n=1 Tax=Purpureocillium lilacinum TaxID=33203 RepID=A0ACC4EAM5_PURLI